MKECLIVLQDITKAKDQEIEQYLEEFAEEKVSEQMNMKTKYNRMITMQKAKQDCTDEKIKALEDKKKQEEAQLAKDLADRKNEETQKIKDGYNIKAGEIKLNFEEIRDAVELWSKYRPD